MLARGTGGRLAGVTEELLDVIDPGSGVVVEARPRSQVHQLGLWHQVFHCLIVRPTAQSVVLQRRSPQKKAFPDKLDLTATGHLSAGETPLDGVRELREEMGVAFEAERLVPIGQRLLADDGGEGLNREVVHLFFLADDRPISDYAPAEDEVSGLVEISAADFVSLLADRALTIPAQAWSRRSGLTTSTMVRSDLVAETSGYWRVVAVMAQRFLNGEEPLAI